MLLRYLKSYIYNSVAELRYIKDVLGLADKIKNLSKIYTYARNFLYLGRGYNYPTALEGALKLKEISYIHAEGYPAAEMKHGPIALVDSEMPTVVIAPTDSLYDKIISNVRQVKARGGTVVAIITKGNDAMKDIADHCPTYPNALHLSLFPSHCSCWPITSPSTRIGMLTSQETLLNQLP